MQTSSPKPEGALNYQNRLGRRSGAFRSFFPVSVWNTQLHYDVPWDAKYSSVPYFHLNLFVVRFLVCLFGFCLPIFQFLFSIVTTILRCCASTAPAFFLEAFCFLALIFSLRSLSCLFSCVSLYFSICFLSVLLSFLFSIHFLCHV